MGGKREYNSLPRENDLAHSLLSLRRKSNLISVSNSVWFRLWPQASANTANVHALLGERCVTSKKRLRLGEDYLMVSRKLPGK